MAGLLNDNLTGQMLNTDHFSVIISILCSKPPVTCVYFHTLIDIYSATSELANPILVLAQVSILVGLEAKSLLKSFV